MAHKQVVIIGNIGAGKTTLLEKMKYVEGCELVPADEFYLTNPFFPKSKEDPVRWEFTDDLWFFIKRAKMTHLFLPKLKSTNLIIDSGVLMSYVYAKSHHASGQLSEDEWALFEEIFDELCKSIPLPDMVIFLTAPFEVLRARIVERNRDFEVAGYFEYLNAITVGLESLVDKLKELKIPLLTIDTAPLHPDEIAQRVEDAIKR